MAFSIDTNYLCTISGKMVGSNPCKSYALEKCLLEHVVLYLFKHLLLFYMDGLFAIQLIALEN